MKDYNEVAQDILRRRDEYAAARKRQRKRVGTAVSCFCLCALVGVGAWASGTLGRQQLPHEDIDAEYGAVFNETSQDAVQKQTPVSPEQSASETPSAPLVAGAAGTVQPAPADPPESNIPAPADPPGSQPVPGSVVGEDDTLNWFCIFGSSLEWNGKRYDDFGVGDISAYTQDKFLGHVGDFEGNYGEDDNDVHYYIHPGDSVYSVKETDTVLFVVKADGALRTMRSADWAPETFEPAATPLVVLDPTQNSFEQ